MQKHESGNVGKYIVFQLPTFYEIHAKIIKIPLRIGRGVVGRGRGGLRPPTFFDRGTRPPLPPLFWIEIRAKVSPLLQLATY